MDENYKDKIKEWKSCYHSIFVVKIKDQDYVYRGLIVRECEKIFKLLGESEVEAEDVALGAVLYPENFDPEKVPLSTSKKLAQYILDSSKIFKPNGISELIEDARKTVEERMQSDIFQWKLMLTKVFPGYSLSDLDKLESQEFFNLLILAEKLTNEKLINYGQLEKTRIESEKLNNVDTSNVVTGDKFMSKGELDQISADQSTQNLREHWNKHKNKG